VYEPPRDIPLLVPSIINFEVGMLWRWERIRSHSCHAVGVIGSGLVVGKVIAMVSQNSWKRVIIWPSGCEGLQIVFKS
jgi:hypothetical protein